MVRRSPFHAVSHRESILLALVFATTCVAPAFAEDVTQSGKACACGAHEGSAKERDLVNTAPRTLRVPADYLTIQEAIDASSDGDTVLVGDNHYDSAIDFRGKAITVAAEHGVYTAELGPPTLVWTNAKMGRYSERTQLPDEMPMTPPTVRFSQREGGRSVLQGFRIYGNIDIVGASPTLRYNIFMGPGGAVRGVDASPTISNNEFTDVTCAPTAGVLYFAARSSPQIHDNLFHDNNCAAIALGASAGAHPMVYNNTIVHNTAALVLDRYDPNDKLVVRNNIIAFNEADIDHFRRLQRGVDYRDYPRAVPLKPVWKNNLVYGNERQHAQVRAWLGRNGNLAADPKFTKDEASQNFLDYTPMAGSPAIDGGIAEELSLQPFDLDLQPRIMANIRAGKPTIDIGAIEAAAPGKAYSNLKHWRVCHTCMPVAVARPWIDFSGSEPRFVDWVENLEQQLAAEVNAAAASTPATR
jgi:opacity protein-like surface antigen